jgi:hypothetical protein
MPVGGLMTRIPRQSTATGFRDLHRQQVRDVRGRFGGGWGFAWVGLEAVANNIEELEAQIHENVSDAAEQLAEDMLEYAETNAPWTDQTGDARGHLQAAVTWSDKDHFTIFLGHGEDIAYGVWLEVRWGGKYAIIVPTIMAFAPQLGGRIRTL